NITYSEDGNYTIEAPFEGSFLNMMELSAAGIDPTNLDPSSFGEIEKYRRPFLKDSLQMMMLRAQYQLAGISFVVPEPVTKGKFGVVKVQEGEPANQDALIVEVSSKNEIKTVELLGGKGSAPNPKEVEVGGLKVYLTYGSKEIDLPFSITLNDFIADKYPGTEKGYSAFKSKVTVINDDKTHFDAEIFMNNVLDHNGYRFFQAGFDPDEGGTILSVNHDWWGTWITYIGYFLLYFGLMAILFSKHSRFGKLEEILNRIKRKKKSMITVLVMMLSLSGFS